MNLVQALSVAIGLVLVTILTAAAFGSISWLWFWTVAAIAAFYSYILLPRLRR